MSLPANVVELRPPEAKPRVPNAARERLLRAGPAALADAELLEVVMHGRRGPTPDYACVLFEAGGLKPLLRREPHELARTAKFGKAGAAALLAAVELGRRYLRATDERPRLSSPEAIYHYLLPKLGGLPREVFHVLSFNSRNVLLDDTRVAEGTQTTCPVDPGDVFRAALRARATAIALAHTHPSGASEPSRQDIELTRHLHAAGLVLGIKVLDHLVMGDGCFSSMRMRGEMPVE